ncbi:hypothetical protein HaLaN_15043, partial [Haematococcus lacustris]
MPVPYITVAAWLRWVCSNAMLAKGHSSSWGKWSQGCKVQPDQDDPDSTSCRGQACQDQQLS